MSSNSSYTIASNGVKYMFSAYNFDHNTWWFSTKQFLMNDVSNEPKDGFIGQYISSNWYNINTLPAKQLYMVIGFNGEFDDIKERLEMYSRMFGQMANSGEDFAKMCANDVYGVVSTDVFCISKHTLTMHLLNLTGACTTDISVKEITGERDMILTFSTRKIMHGTTVSLNISTPSFKLKPADNVTYL